VRIDLLQRRRNQDNLTTKAPRARMFPPGRPRSTGLSILSTASRAKKSPLSKRACERKQSAAKLPMRRSPIRKR